MGACGLLSASLAPLGGIGTANAESIPDLVARSKRSVVAVGTFAPLRNPSFRFAGTGFAIGDGRQIATCAHVLAPVDPGAGERLAISIPESEGRGRVAEVRPVTISREYDAAVLVIQDSAVTLPALPLDETPMAREGTDVVLIGFPIGSLLGIFATTHRGVVGSVTPRVTPSITSAGLNAQSVLAARTGAMNLFQLDAIAYPGNSGSPLIDTQTGAVIGIVNMGLVKANREAALGNPTGISYAVPVQYLRDLLAR